jgi:alpha-1,3-rhamnosyl/mannosyltransferase
VRTDTDLAPGPPPTPARLAWVYDLNACRSPTGVTRHALAQLDELRRRPGRVAVRLVTGRVREPDGRAFLGARPDVPRTLLPLSLRDMLRAWRVAPWPPLEAWTGPLDWIYGPAEFFVPARSARRAVTSHDVQQDLAYGGPRRRALLARAFGTADRVLSVSKYNTARLVEAFPHCADRVREVPNAAEDLFFEPPTEAERAAVRADLGLPPGMPYLLSVANVQPRKNLARLVRAASRVAEVAAGELALALVGTGDVIDPELRAALAAAGPRVRIVTPGYRQGPALRALYAEATALVFPSLCESFGIPTVEAMAQGLPVALADTTALPEVAGDAGWYLDPTSEESIAAAIRALLDAPDERARRVALGRERAQHYRWSAAGDRLLQALDLA